MEDSPPFSVIISPSQQETMWQCRTLAGFLCLQKERALYVSRMNQRNSKGKLFFSEALKAIACPALRSGAFEHLIPAWRAESCEGCKSDSLPVTRLRGFSVRQDLALSSHPKYICLSQVKSNLALF